MQPAYPPVSRPSSSSSPEGRGTNQGAHEGGALPGTWLYKVPRERGLGWYLAGSIVLFTVLTSLASLLPPEEKLPPMIEVDLGTDAIENEPPPLGEIDAGASEPAEAPVAEPMPEEETQPPEPEPEPEPPEPEPSVEEPVPPPAPEFVAPKEELPPPKPRPKPVAKIPPKVVRKPAPIQVAGPATAPPSAPAGSGLSTGRIGVRGSPGGKPGGKGGGRGDFISTPSPQYDSVARQRGYRGSGLFVIHYENGRVVSVATQRSTGVAYLDSRTIAWIQSRWRVKSGVSGTATLPMTWTLQ